MKFFIAALIGLILSLRIWASDSVQSVMPPAKHDSTLISSVSHLSEKILDWVTWQRPHYSLAIFPVVGYSKRTQFEFGLMPVWHINSKYCIDSSFHRPTTIAPSVQISTSGMFETSLDFEVFTHNQISISGKNQFLYLPDMFYGMGNDNKEKELFRYHTYKYFLTADILKGLTNKLFIGLNLDLCHLKNEQAGDIYFESSINGRNGGWTNGIGPTVVFDSRNNTLYPNKGSFIKFTGSLYHKIFGSNYNFSVINLDARHYLSFGEKNHNIIASQFVVNTVQGNAPFYKMSMLGGKSAVRGIGHPQEYITDNMWYYQSEYRRHIWWRLGMVAFAGVGNGFDNISTTFRNSHWFGGFGGRFQALPKEKLNFRIDLGFTNRGDHGIFFTIREAF